MTKMVKKSVKKYHWLCVPEDKARGEKFKSIFKNLHIFQSLLDNKYLKDQFLSRFHCLVLMCHPCDQMLE